MKKFIPLFIFVILLFTACGSKIKSDEVSSNKAVSKEEDKILLANSFWVEKSDYMPFLTDALQRNDREYLKQLILEQKVFSVDRDTRVKSFGYAVNKNEELISFKEGRYTNKTGVTFKKFLLTEDEYQKRIESEKMNELKKAKEKEIKAKQLHDDAVILISNFFDETAVYENVVSGSDFDYASQIEKLCTAKVDTLKKQSSNPQYENATRTMLISAANIIAERRSAIYFYLNLLQYAQKYSQTNPEDYSTKYMSDRAMQDFKKMTDKSIQQEKQLRQEFLNTYGF